MSAVDRLVSSEVLSEFLATLNEYAEKAKELYKRKLTDKGINASYKLLNSVETVVRRNDDTFTVTINLEDYWYYVENGRKAGKFPPIYKILEWVRVKPVIPYSDSRGRLPTEEQLAFLISRKIAEQGTEPKRVLAETITELNNYYLPLLKQALDRDFARLNYEIDTYIGSLRV